MSENIKHESQMWYEQKAVIEFLRRGRIHPTEIHRCLKAIFGNETLNVSKCGTGYAWQ